MNSVRRFTLPLAALVAGLVATLAAALLMAEAEAGRREARFRGLAHSAESAIESRMLVQLTLLRGMAGLFNASDEVSRDEFRAYAARLNLARNYPGVLGIGYSAFRPPARGQAGGSSAILYLEPQNRLNAQALGYDMLSEATRRQAMQAAQKSGVSVLSGRVRLRQEIEPVKQPGFLIYTPLYRARTGLFYGWVYSPLRAYDLFGAIFAHSDLRDIAVEVFDGPPAESNLLYRSAQPVRSAEYRSERPLKMAGRTWTVRVTSSSAFTEDTAVPAPLGVAAAGALISLLAAFILYLQGRAARRTEDQVLLRTAELRAANAQLVAEGEARKAAEAKVAQMQKMEAIGQLTGGIAHDFNNMLTVVIGNLDIARRRIADPERVARAIDHAAQGAQKAADLTQSLLAFGRQAPLRPQLLDPRALVGGMADMLRRTLGETIDLQTAVALDSWSVCVDRAQLESALLNLAINARDAMADGGRLRIETGNVELRDGDLPQAETPAIGPHLRIAVADTGHGMSPDVLERALDPFFTTKPIGKGTGLGLSQVFGFVRQSGGHLAIASTPGAGTTVSIYLPRHQGEQVRAVDDQESRAEDLLRARPGETILVVEDEDQVREISVETLQELGYRVIAASGAAEAMARLSEASDVDLLFTDVVMPETDGRLLATQALAEHPDLKVLFTTGYARDAIVHDGRVDADVELLEKPFTAAQLARKVRALLDA
jgi:signal transduction histidine kinase/CheY-like chemotaxis protein